MFWHKMLLLLALSGFVAQAQTADQQLPVQNDKILQISAGEWPPYLGLNLPGHGLAARLISDIFHDAGYQVRFHFLPWPRAYRETQLGRYNATAVWMAAAERQQHFWYSEAVLEEQFVFFHLKKTAFQFETLDDLVGIELGGGLGYSYGPAFDAALASGRLKISRVGDTTQNFRRLLKGRIRAFPEEIQVGYHKLRTDLPSELNQITHASLPLLKNQSFVLFPKSEGNSLKLQKIFDDGLARYKKSSRYAGYFELNTKPTH